MKIEDFSVRKQFEISFIVEYCENKIDVKDVAQIESVK